jgi:hypothetical protein
VILSDRACEHHAHEIRGQDRFAVSPGREHGLPKPRAVQTEFEHHGIHDRDRGGGERHARQPTRLRRPAKHEIGVGRASEERCRETDKTHHASLAPLRAEHCGIEFRAGEKGEKHGSGGGEERDPALCRAEEPGADERADEQLCDGPDDDFR